MQLGPWDCIHSGWVRWAVIALSGRAVPSGRAVTRDGLGSGCFFRCLYLRLFIQTHRKLNDIGLSGC
jgi:hypothetical protein